MSSINMFLMLFSLVLSLLIFGQTEFKEYSIQLFFVVFSFIILFELYILVFKNKNNIKKALIVFEKNKIENSDDLNNIRNSFLFLNEIGIMFVNESHNQKLLNIAHIDDNKNISILKSIPITNDINIASTSLNRLMDKDQRDSYLNDFNDHIQNNILNKKDFCWYFRLNC